MALPLEAVASDRRRFRRAVVWLLAANVGVALVLTLAGRELNTAASPNGIFSFEFAGSAADASRILDAWDERQRAYAGFALGLDYLYMPLYAAGLALLCAKAALAARARGKAGLSKAAAVAAYASITAAILDAVENAASLDLLVSTPTDTWAKAVVVTATIKFALIAAVLLFLGAAVLILRPWRGTATTA